MKAKTKKETLMIVAKNLRTLRKQNKFTQDQVADKLFICRSAYSHYERGHIAFPTHRLSDLRALYHLTDMNVLFAPIEQAA